MPCPRDGQGQAGPQAPAASCSAPLRSSREAKPTGAHPDAHREGLGLGAWGRQKATEKRQSDQEGSKELQLHREPCRTAFPNAGFPTPAETQVAVNPQPSQRVPDAEAASSPRGPIHDPSSIQPPQPHPASQSHPTPAAPSNIPVPSSPRSPIQHLDTIQPLRPHPAPGSGCRQRRFRGSQLPLLAPSQHPPAELGFWGGKGMLCPPAPPACRRQRASGKFRSGKSQERGKLGAGAFGVGRKSKTENIPLSIKNHLSN